VIWVTKESLTIPFSCLNRPNLLAYRPVFPQGDCLVLTQETSPAVGRSSSSYGTVLSWHS